MATWVQPGMCAWCGQIVPANQKSCPDASDADRKARAGATASGEEKVTLDKCQKALREHGYK